MAQLGKVGRRRGKQGFFLLMLDVFMVMALALLMTPAVEVKAAAAVEYYQASWNGTSGKVIHTKMSIEATPVTASMKNLSEGWYVVNSDVAIADRIKITGTVNLILADGKTLTASKGITTTGAALNIYAQTRGTGKLVAGDENEGNTYKNLQFAGIGGEYSDTTGGAGGSLSIHGGTVKAFAGIYSAGIGGAGGKNTAGGDGGPVVIYGGTVTAKGGSYGAGIGGGSGGINSFYAGKGGAGGEVTIYGGTVEVSCGTAGAAIGGGYGFTDGGAGGKVTVAGGTVKAVTGGTGAGIGGGGGYNKGGDGGTLIVKGGAVEAGNDLTGVGIGGGLGDSGGGKGGTVTIEAGSVIAKGGKWGAGVGGGSAMGRNGAGGSGAEITINNGSLEATGGLYAPGIGGGSSDFQAGGGGGKLTINGGTVKAFGGPGGAGIGGGNGYTAGGAGSEVTIGKAVTLVIAKGGENSPEKSENALGIGGGYAYQYGRRSSDAGSLTVESPLKLFGGQSQNALSEISSNNGTYERYPYMMVQKVLHSHSFTYTGSGASITAKCSNTGCDLSDSKVTITLKAPQNLTCDGNGKAVSIEGYPAETVEDLAPKPTIVYVKLSTTAEGQPQSEDVEGLPTDPGEYLASISWGGQSAAVGFIIEKRERSVTPPAAKTDLVYNGEAQALVAAGSAYNGDMQYALGTDGTAAPAETAYTTDIPAAVNAGTWYVWYRVPETEIYKEILGGPIAVTIGKADSAVTLSPKGVENLIYNKEAQALVSAGTASGGTLKYAAASGSTAPANADYKVSVPVAVNAGNYSVWYKIFGDENHKDSEAVKIGVTIAKAPAQLSYAASAVSMTIEEKYTNPLTNPYGVTVTYESSDESVAKVSSTGEVSVIAEGEAEITATAEDQNYAGSASFRVLVSNHLAKISGHSLTLDGGKIGVNFIVDPDESDVNGLSADVLRDGSYEPIALHWKNFDGTRCICFTVYVNAKQMTDRIQVRLFGGDRFLASDNYSVRDYYDAYKAGGYDDAKTQELLDALVTYGGMAQQYFDYRTEDLANKDVPLFLPEVPETIARASGKVPEGLSIRGATLLLEEDISVRLYFDCSGDISPYTFLIDGSVVTPSVSEDSSKGQYYLTAEHFQSYKLDSSFTFVFRNSKNYRRIVYGPLCYAYSIQKSSDDTAFAGLVKALYSYNQKAKAYIEA